MILEFSKKRHIYSLKTALLTISYTIIYLLFLSLQRNLVDSDYLFFGVFLVLNIGPALLIHYEYFKYNYKRKYEITNSGILEISDSNERKIEANEINRIVIYLPPSRYRRSEIKLLAIEEYYFAEIQLKNNQNLILTCLLSTNLEQDLKVIENVVIKRKKALVASVFFWKRS